MAKKKTPKLDERFNLAISNKQKKQLEAVVEYEDLSGAEIIREALERWFAENEYRFCEFCNEMTVIDDPASEFCENCVKEGEMERENIKYNM